MEGQRYLLPALFLGVLFLHHADGSLVLYKNGTSRVNVNYWERYKASFVAGRQSCNITVESLRLLNDSQACLGACVGSTAEFFRGIIPGVLPAITNAEPRNLHLKCPQITNCMYPNPLNLPVLLLDLFRKWPSPYPDIDVMAKSGVVGRIHQIVRQASVTSSVKSMGIDLSYEELHDLARVPFSGTNNYITVIGPQNYHFNSFPA